MFQMIRSGIIDGMTSRLQILFLTLGVFVYRNFISLMSPLLNIFLSKKNPKPHVCRISKHQKPVIKYEPLPPLDRKPTCEFLFDVSCMYAIYQQGICQAFYEDLDHDLMKRSFLFTGISGGITAAIYMFMSMCGIGTPRYFYEYYSRKLTKMTSNSYLGILGNHHDELWDLLCNYYEICSHLGVKESDVNERLRIVVTEMKYVWFRMKVLKNFANSAAFADSAVASMLIPYITVKRFSMNIDGSHCLDGFFTYQNKNYPLETRGRIVFTLVPELVDKGDNIFVVDIRNEEMKRGLSINKLIGSASMEEMDKMFEDGYAWGKANSGRIASILQFILA
jgi:hypothetical protein